jgi:hypothetical protein
MGCGSGDDDSGRRVDVRLAIEETNDVVTEPLILGGDAVFVPDTEIELDAGIGLKADDEPGGAFDFEREVCARLDPQADVTVGRGVGPRGPHPGKPPRPGVGRHGKPGVDRDGGAGPLDGKAVLLPPPAVLLLHSTSPHIEVHPGASGVDGGSECRGRDEDGRVCHGVMLSDEVLVIELLVIEVLVIEVLVTEVLVIELLVVVKLVTHVDCLDVVVRGIP